MVGKNIFLLWHHLGVATSAVKSKHEPCLIFSCIPANAIARLQKKTPHEFSFSFIFYMIFQMTQKFTSFPASPSRLPIQHATTQGKSNLSTTSRPPGLAETGNRPCCQPISRCPPDRPDWLDAGPISKVFERTGMSIIAGSRVLKQRPQVLQTEESLPTNGRNGMAYIRTRPAMRSSDTDRQAVHPGASQAAIAAFHDHPAFADTNHEVAKPSVSHAISHSASISLVNYLGRQSTGTNADPAASNAAMMSQILPGCTHPRRNRRDAERSILAFRHPMHERWQHKSG